MLWALGTWPGGLVPAACIATVRGARERASVESPVPTPGLSSFRGAGASPGAARDKLGNHGDRFRLARVTSCPWCSRTFSANRRRQRERIDYLSPFGGNATRTSVLVRGRTGFKVS